jgi:hypothetical protein
MKRTVKPKPKGKKKGGKRKPTPAISLFQPPTGPVRGALFTPMFR